METIIGWENENLFRGGHEDWERIVRAQKWDIFMNDTEKWYHKIFYGIGSVILFPIVVLPVLFILLLMGLAYCVQERFEHRK